MSNKLYVGNLSFRVTSEDLHEYFAAAGAVESANVVFDRETGRSRGFGFVEMSSQSEVQKAISMFNGYTMNDRQLKVNPAKPREERSGGFRQQRGGNNNRRY